MPERYSYGPRKISASNICKFFKTWEWVKAPLGKAQIRLRVMRAKKIKP